MALIPEIRKLLGLDSIRFTPQAASPSTPASGFIQFADNAGNPSWVGVDGQVRRLGSGAPESASTSLALSAGATGTTSITLPRTAILKRIVVSQAAWVRLYNSIAARNADSTRPINIAPTAGSGVLLEVAVGTSTDLSLSPNPSAVNAEAPTTTSYPVRLTNNGATNTITITLYYLPLES